MKTYLQAIIIGVLIWLTGTMMVKSTDTVYIPVDFSGLSGPLAVADDNLTVPVVISGSKWLLMSPEAYQLRAKVDLASITASGVIKANLTVERVRGPITIIKSPEQVTINIANSASKSVPINLTFSGKLPEGYSIKNYQIEPPTIVVTGADKVLGGINSVDVDVNLRNRKSDFSVFGLPLSYNATGGLRSNVAFQPYEVKITVGIEKGEALKAVGVAPVFINELPEGILIKNIVFDPPVISLQGGQALLDTIETVKSTPINLSNRFNDFTDQVAVDVPKGLEMRGKNLISVKVNLMTIKDTKTLILVPKFINLAEGLAVSDVDPSAVKVNLTGKADALNKLKADDVVLEVDLRGLVSGVQEITLANANFKIKDDVVAVSSFDPQVLKLQIVKQSN